MANLGPEQQTEPPRQTPSSGTRLAVLAAIGVVVAAGFGALTMVTTQGDDAAPRGPVATTTVQTTDGVAPPASTETKTNTRTKTRTETDTRTSTNTETQVNTQTDTQVRTDVQTQTVTKTLPQVTITRSTVIEVPVEPTPSRIAPQGPRPSQ